jgi:hypothetical protein|tara:strand:- start:307 stop:642 length:336 start_codon:yes stop_codon:yes gene_type:complete
MAAKKRKLKLSNKINVNVKDKWERILLDVDKPEVPIEVLERIMIHLIDGTKVNINVMELLAEGTDPEELEERLNDKLEQLDHMILDIDFFVNIDGVAKTIQPETDKILSKL